MKWLIGSLIVLFVIGIFGFSSIFSFQTEQHEQSGTNENTGGEHQESDLEKMGLELNGEWSRNLLNNTGSLIITNATKNSFVFTLDVLAGGNTGMLEGTANWEGETATWLDHESGCELTFQLYKNKITIEQNSACEFLGGTGTFFYGEYEKGAFAIETDLVEQGVLNESEDALFRNVVGEEYELYLQNMSSYSDGEDRDGLGTRVVSGFVRGLGTISEGIIMVNKGNIYAAVTDSQNSVIRYHTNDPTYQETLPDTIAHWKESLAYEEIVYQ